MKALIYKAIFPNGKCYIGQTIDLEKRKRSYFNDHSNVNLKSYNYAFHRAIRKYGWDNIKWEVLEDKIQEEHVLDLKEKSYIMAYKSQNPKYGYNMTEGGEGTGRGENHPLFGKSLVFSQEHKDNISKTKKEMFASGKLINPMKGKKRLDLIELNKKKRKLTETQIIEIRNDLVCGLNVHRISKKLNVSYSTIVNIRDRKTYKDVVDDTQVF